MNQPPPTNNQDSYNIDTIEEEEEGIEFPEELDEEFKKREEMIMLMAQAGNEALKPLGHQFDEFILSCRYRGVSCG